jgi:tRNA G18 (ribose-2'-O)-methylase SpoU
MSRAQKLLNAVYEYNPAMSTSPKVPAAAPANSSIRPSDANWPPQLRGYFAIGAERSSKALNLGNLMRSAHGFGAAFTFTVGATYQALEARADTSKGQVHLPHYNWGTLADMRLPVGCQLIGIELIDEAIDLPDFRHPLRAAYILGPELGSLSPATLAACAQVVKIPTSFCVNVAMAGAIVMYDRHKQLRPPKLPG